MASSGVLLAALVLAAGLPSPVHAADHGIEFEATVGGRALSDVTENEPLAVRPEDDMPVHIKITNSGPAPVEVRSVRLIGEALGVPFFTYGTRIDLPLQPGATDTRDFQLDVSDLSVNATGLLPGRIVLLDRDRKPLAEARFTVDVRGSLRSAYGIFSLLVALATLLLLGAALLRLALGRLPENRWYRAVRFAVPGIGLGLTLTFTLSALGRLVPDPTTWPWLVVSGGFIGLVAGYLTPTPRAQEADDEAEATGAREPELGVETTSEPQDAAEAERRAPRPEETAAVPLPSTPPEPDQAVLEARSPHVRSS
jgi:hypothetical protein